MSLETIHDDNLSLLSEKESPGDMPILLNELQNSKLYSFLSSGASDLVIT